MALALDLNANIDVTNIYHLPFIDAAKVPAEYIGQMMMEKKNFVNGKLEKLAALIPNAARGEILPVYGIFVPHEIQSMRDQTGPC